MLFLFLLFQEGGRGGIDYWGTSVTGSFLKPVMMGVFQAQILKPFFKDKDALPSTQVRGGGVSNLIIERLKRGMPTDAITLDHNATLPIQCFRSPIANLWVVKRRSEKCIRDGYREERRLIRQALVESDADVCHAHWTYEYGLAAVSQGIKPYVVTVRDHSFNILRWVGLPYLGQYCISQYVLHKASGRLTAVSPYIADYVSRITKNDVPVIPNIVPILEERPEARIQRSKVGGQQAEERGSQTIVVTVADSGRLKNVKRAIKAFQLYRAGRKNIQHILVGTGLDVHGPIARWATTNGLSENVEFVGWMPHDDILDMMVRSAAVVLHPSLEESFGNPVAEAMALGVPVIGASEAGGVRWLLNNDCGWLVSGRSVTEIAGALSEALGSKEFRRQKCNLARQRISRLCCPDTILTQYERVYEKVVGR